MTVFEEGMDLLEGLFGGGKDNQIALASIAIEKGANGAARPTVRTVDAYYENGTFYVVTYAKSNKILQVLNNADIAVSTYQEMFTAGAVGENLGWVLAPQNAAIRTKLRTAFSAWYDMANNEDDENCCILAIRLTKGILNINHWEKLYHMDFLNRTIIEDAGIH